VVVVGWEERAAINWQPSAFYTRFFVGKKKAAG
jgi:hypothetical protein